MVTFGLRHKLVGMSLFISASVLVAVAAYDAAADEAVVLALKEAAQDLTEAVEVSVQQLGPSAHPDEALLGDYLRRHGRAGVRQIRVLRPDKSPLARANRQKAFFIEESGPEDGRLKWDLLVPVVIGRDKLGYVELSMTSADFEHLLSRVRWERTGVTAIAFGIGLLLTLFLAKRLSQPLEALRAAARRIAAGELEVPLPPASGDEVGELVRGFSEMVDGLKERETFRGRLEEAEREAMLGRMAAGIAHDVRNPLNYLSLAVDHLLAQHSTPESERIAAQMKTELQRANQRITELLRLGKPVPIHPQPLEARGWLEALATSTSVASHLVRLVPGDQQEVEWDPSVVEGILRNLITNATQASPEGPIELALEAQQDRVVVSVADRGPGLGPEADAHLFEPWFTTKATGIGLGLAIARRAARDHGGELSARDREGGGAVFVLSLPRRPGGTS